ncbi:L-ascorbate 6-phosphate lactonase [Amorphus suaedae]
MKELAALSVPADGVALWPLGQSGYLVKSPGGTVIAIDPYLSDRINGMRPGLDTSRQVPLPMPPDELLVDLYLCTHSHADHACPETIAGSRRAGTRRFAGPAQALEVFAESGVPADERMLTYPKQAFTVGDVTITGTFALPTDATDLNHMGFVLDVAGGPRVYITGDTAPSPLLRAAKVHAPDVMIVCINGGYGNLSHFEAAELVRDIDPQVALPCHHDMFIDNSCPPHLFRASLAILDIADKYRLPRVGEAYVHTLSGPSPEPESHQ